MPEYIERENAYKLISEQKEKETGMYSKGRNTGLNIAKSIIHNKEQCPSADAVEVVRCCDCKHKVEYLGRIMCDLRAQKYRNKIVGLIATEENHFCSYGELKEREGK